jgi:hypothetical protein
MLTDVAAPSNGALADGVLADLEDDAVADPAALPGAGINCAATICCRTI